MCQLLISYAIRTARSEVSCSITVKNPVSTMSNSVNLRHIQASKRRINRIDMTRISRIPFGGNLHILIFVEKYLTLMISPDFAHSTHIDFSLGLKPGQAQHYMSHLELARLAAEFRQLSHWYRRDCDSSSSLK
jgi:hypothetical protein